MDNTESRKKIALHFFFLVEGVDDTRIAKLLGRDVRQVQRLRNGTNVPQGDTAQRMIELIDLAKRDALLTPAERSHQDEQRRADAEMRQRITKVRTINGLEEKEIPLWFSKVRTFLDAEKWNEALDRLRDRVEDRTDWQNVPERTRPYVLADLGVCYHKTGRFVEAIKVSDEAIRERISLSQRHLSNYEQLALDNFLCTIYSNLGCSYMQMHSFDNARHYFRLATEHRRDWAPAYYNAICAASIEKHSEELLVAIGALRLAALTLLTAADIDEIVDDAQNDKDLAFAQSFAMFSEVLSELRDFARRKRDGSLRLDIPREGEKDDMP
ncbi:tetratricopeptide repeat protein [Skermanella mucosa]|uniref:tetratricopeptide repeat protein n=1 Tax=Skermanella TaxID=204447 RepID=UPI00192AD88E|nr:tetratricopeptide repeat protein [Skermanella mucosa]UEM21289.1 tetratricopeptide repeat protein [Skermanella mucosa]